MRIKGGIIHDLPPTACIRDLWMREYTLRGVVGSMPGHARLILFPEEVDGMRLVYKSPYYAAALYAVPPLHWILKFRHWLRGWRTPLFLLGFIEADEHHYYGPPGNPTWHLNIWKVHRRRWQAYRKMGLTGLSWTSYLRTAMRRDW